MNWNVTAAGLYVPCDCRKFFAKGSNWPIKPNNLGKIASKWFNYIYDQEQTWVEIDSKYIFQRYDEAVYAWCKQCNATYYWPLSSLSETKILVMHKNITKGNWSGHYVGWCMRNSVAPMKYDTLISLFEYTADNEYPDYLETLYECLLKGAQMNSPDKLTALRAKLIFRLELFKRIPTATNMLLAYNLIEEIILATYKGGNVDITEDTNKKIERFDKLKSLALGTKFINERKLAFLKSVEVYEKLVAV